MDFNSSEQRNSGRNANQEMEDQGMRLNIMNNPYGNNRYEIDRMNNINNMDNNNSYIQPNFSNNIENNQIRGNYNNNSMNLANIAIPNQNVSMRNNLNLNNKMDYSNQLSLFNQINDNYNRNINNDFTNRIQNNFPNNYTNSNTYSNNFNNNSNRNTYLYKNNIQNNNIPKNNNNYNNRIRQMNNNFYNNLNMYNNPKNSFNNQMEYNSFSNDLTPNFHNFSLQLYNDNDYPQNNKNIELNIPNNNSQDNSIMFKNEIITHQNNDNFYDDKQREINNDNNSFFNNPNIDFNNKNLNNNNFNTNEYNNPNSNNFSNNECQNLNINNYFNRNLNESDLNNYLVSEKEEDIKKLQVSLFNFHKIIEYKIEIDLSFKLGTNFLDMLKDHEIPVLCYFKNKNALNKDIIKIEEELMNYNIGNFERIRFITISQDIINQMINKIGYIKTKEDEEIINNIKKINSISNNNNVIFCYNKDIFYSNNIMSLYSPHILIKKKDITSIFLNDNQKYLSIYDFQYIHLHKNDDHIFKKLLEKRVSEFNSNSFNKNFTGFFKNYMYTVMDKDIVENKLKFTNFKLLIDQLLCNPSEINSISEKEKLNNMGFINVDNIQYLEGLSFKETILYIILNRLQEYIQLPNIIFYECYRNIKGERIVVSNKGLLNGYQKIDYALYSKENFSFDEQFESPLYVQAEYFYNSDKQFVVNDNYYLFKIHQNRLYFFEFKYSLEIFNQTKNQINEQNIKSQINEQDIQGPKNPEKFLEDLIGKCREFKSLYEEMFSIPKNTQIEIIIFYDDIISDILTSCQEKIKSLIANDNIKFSIVYVLPSYPYFFHQLTQEKEQKIEKLRIEYEEMKKKLEDFDEMKKILEDFDETKKKFIEVEKRNEENQKKLNYNGEIQNKFIEMDKKYDEIKKKLEKKEKNDEIISKGDKYEEMNNNLENIDEIENNFNDIKKIIDSNDKFKNNVENFNEIKKKLKDFEETKNNYYEQKKFIENKEEKEKTIEEEKKIKDNLNEVKKKLKKINETLLNLINN